MHNRFVFFFAFFLFLLLVPLKSYAAEIKKITPEKFIIGENVVIEGNGFGTSGDICFGSNNDKCIPEASIKSWSNTEITFLMNVKGLSIHETLNVIYLDQCAYKTYDTCVSRWKYVKGPYVNIAPYIYTVKTGKSSYSVGSGELAKLEEGGIAEIEGIYFGDNPGVVAFGDERAVIISWSDEHISFKVPSVKKVITEMAVWNAYTSSKVYPVNLQKKYTNDPYLYEQDYLSSIKYWDAYENYKNRGEGIIVAVIDSGINWNHQDFLGQIAINKDEINGNGIDDDKNGYIDDYYGYNFVEKTGEPTPYAAHGSLVAGIISAKANNGVGISGIAPSSKIMPLTVCDAQNCGMDNIILAVDYAINNGANVINLSLGGIGTFNDFNDRYTEVFKKAYEKNIPIIVAAGNGDYLSSIASVAYGRFLNNAPNSPVCNDGGSNFVIGVASIEKNGTRSKYSDYGSNCIDVSAYGSSVFSLSHPAFSSTQSDYDTASGTSMAAPQVSGAVAILLSKNPSLTPWEIAEYLRHSGDEIDSKNEEYAKGNLSKGLNINSLLSYIPKKGDFPDIKITKAEIKDGNLYLEGDYFAKDMSVIINYEINQKSYSSSFKNGFISAVSEKVSLKGLNIQKDDDKKIDIELSRYDGAKILIKEISILENKTENPIVKNEDVKNSFPDVASDYKNAKAIFYLKEKGILEGYPDGTFKPENPVNRAELVKILVSKSVIPDIKDYHDCFVDVKKEWFAPYVCYAKSLNWIGGYADGKFKPSQTVNKAEALKIFLNAEKIEIPLAIYEEPFLDVKANDWFAPYVYKAKEMKILEEEGKYFEPSGFMKRAGISEILYRILTLKK